MSQIDIQFYNTKIGEMILGAFGDKLCLLDFRYRKMRKAVDNRIKWGLKADFSERENQLLDQTKTQLNEYLNQEREAFDLPLLMVGSDFQKSVWNALMEVPYGATSTYLQLARAC